MQIAVVVGISFILSAILNGLASKKGWKKKAEIYVDDKSYLKALPVALVILYIVTVMLLPRVGIILPVVVLITIQIICITFAVFLFELFR